MQNRIIKFRGFDKLHNTWIYGDLIRIPTDGGDYNTPPSSELTTYVTNSHVLTHEWVEVDPNSVGQFSGLLDKNGKEIYENDVIKCWDNAAKDESWGLDKEHVGVIEYTANFYSLKIKGKQTVNTPCLKNWDNDVFLDMWCNAENIEIIGNFYENHTY